MYDMPEISVLWFYGGDFVMETAVICRFFPTVIGDGHEHPAICEMWIYFTVRKAYSEYKGSFYVIISLGLAVDLLVVVITEGPGALLVVWSIARSMSYIIAQSIA